MTGNTIGSAAGAVDRLDVVRPDRGQRRRPPGAEAGLPAVGDHRDRGGHRRHVNNVSDSQACRALANGSDHAALPSRLMAADDTVPSPRRAEFQVQSVADQVYAVLRERIATRRDRARLAAAPGGPRERVRRLPHAGPRGAAAARRRGPRRPVRQPRRAGRDGHRRAAALELRDPPGRRARRRPDRRPARLEARCDRAMRAAIRDEEMAGRSSAKLFKANREFHLALVEGDRQPAARPVHGARLDRPDRRDPLRDADGPERAAGRQRRARVDRRRDRGRRRRARRDPHPRPPRAGDGAPLRRGRAEAIRRARFSERSCPRGSAGSSGRSRSRARSRRPRGRCR